MADKKTWRRGRLAACVVLAGAAAAGWWYSTSQAGLPLQEVDRLRMLALAGQDGQSFAPLKHAARQGNVAAQRALAEVMLQRPELAQDGLQFAEDAARQGDVASHYMLGKAYFDGSATGNRVPDMARARHWLELAAEKKHAGAMYLLGLMHKNGYGGTPDASMAAQWFARAVQQGHADAMFMLANAYHDGQGVAADEKQALRLYQAAAEKEQPQAAQTLALAYRDGALGLRQDKREAELMMMEVAHILSHPGQH